MNRIVEKIRAMLRRRETVPPDDIEELCDEAEALQDLNRSAYANRRLCAKAGTRLRVQHDQEAISPRPRRAWSCRKAQPPSIWASRPARHRTGRLGSPPFTPAPNACCAFCSTAKSRSIRNRATP